MAVGSILSGEEMLRSLSTWFRYCFYPSIEFLRMLKVHVLDVFICSFGFFGCFDVRRIWLGIVETLMKEEVLGSRSAIWDCNSFAGFVVIPLFHCELGCCGNCK